MPMTPLYTRFPELAAHETRSVHILQAGGGLPAGEYGFVEFYCDEDDCDCRRVLLQVVSPSNQHRVLATINYGWESQEFYTRWMHGDAEAGREIIEAGLDPLNPQSEHAVALLEQRPEAPAEFFGRFAAAAAPYRSYLTVRDTLWGFTHPSQYTKTRSRQEADPFGPERRRYLIIYPFAKTADWYLETQEKRQLMMSGHIKIGKQYEDITQLLLYSFGLQDHEFVVVYETEDLTRFSSLVAELRATEARRYTLRDAPLHVGIHQPDMDALTAWL